MLFRSNKPDKNLFDRHFRCEIDDGVDIGALKYRRLTLVVRIRKKNEHINSEN